MPPITWYEKTPREAIEQDGLSEPIVIIGWSERWWCASILIEDEEVEDMEWDFVDRVALAGRDASEEERTAVRDELVVEIYEPMEG